MPGCTTWMRARMDSEIDQIYEFVDLHTPRGVTPGNTWVHVVLAWFVVVYVLISLLVVLYVWMYLNCYYVVSRLAKSSTYHATRS